MKVYIFAGFVTVLTVAGLAWLLIARFGVAIFRVKKKGKGKDGQEPTGNAGGRGAGGGDGPRWV